MNCTLERGSVLKSHSSLKFGAKSNKRRELPGGLNFSISYNCCHYFSVASRHYFTTRYLELGQQSNKLKLLNAVSVIIIQLYSERGRQTVLRTLSVEENQSVSEN